MTKIQQYVFICIKLCDKHFNGYQLHIIIYFSHTIKEIFMNDSSIISSFLI